MSVISILVRSGPKEHGMLLFACWLCLGVSFEMSTLLDCLELVVREMRD